MVTPSVRQSALEKHTTSWDITAILHRSSNEDKVFKPLVAPAASESGPSALKS